MKTLKLNRLLLTNVRGVKSATLALDGKNATIRARNGAGKTSCATGLTWLFCGRDSEGRATFALRPLRKDGDRLGDLIRGLVVAVEADIEIDGAGPEYDGVWTLRKEEHEKKVEKRENGELKILYSYPKTYYINGDAVKEKDFNKWLEGLAATDVWRMILDPHYFLHGMHWQERSNILRAMAGDVGHVTGYDDVVSALKGRKYDGYLQSLRDEKKAYVKERDGIEPAVGENHRKIRTMTETAGETSIEQETKHE